jgi:hypothetical protein
LPEDHHVHLGALAGHRVQQQEGAVRVAGTGDEQQVGGAVTQPVQSLVGSGDHCHDVEVVVLGQGLLHVLGVDARLDGE